MNLKNFPCCLLFCSVLFCVDIPDIVDSVDAMDPVDSVDTVDLVDSVDSVDTLETVEFCSQFSLQYGYIIWTGLGFISIFFYIQNLCDFTGFWSILVFFGVRTSFLHWQWIHWMLLDGLLYMDMWMFRIQWIWFCKKISY